MDSIESILSNLNQIRLDRIAERKKLRDSIIVHHDYEMFEEAFAEVHEKARKRWEKLNERQTSKNDSGQSGEATDGSKRGETSDDA